MTAIIQAAVVIVALGVMFFALGGRETHVVKAWKKIGLAFLSVGMIVAVTFPETTNKLAHVVGIGRGADLLLYLLTLAFIAFALNSYFRQQDEKENLHRLARKLALLEAVERYELTKKNHPKN
jgi:hypothetical protein